jgi:biotin-dependent carboxylase-like uncharacterized protein
MDQGAGLWANHLLGNQPDAALLEITLGGARFRFGSDALVALTGAQCDAELDGVGVEPWRSFRVAMGQALELGYSTTGMRAYLAFAGGLQAPTIFQSASIVLREGLPGALGRPLRTGETIGWIDGGEGRLLRHAPLRYLPSARKEGEVLELPIYIGYDWHRFSEADRSTVFDATWTVDPASDRVATRLEGPRLRSGPTVLDSVPLVDGTVQVTGDGSPLVFMRDRPTIGGYPKVGSVDPIALDALAQARPGTTVRFVHAEAEAGLLALRRRFDFFGLPSG